MANIPNRSFIPVLGRTADWTVSGEIVGIANIIRVYTRLIRAGGRPGEHLIAASFHADFELDEYIAEMLSGGGGRGSSSALRDAYENDSMENPLTVEVAGDNSGPVINRTLHTESDEDFFLLTPNQEGELVLETTGSIDTYLELYHADSREKLAGDDDGGSGNNACIHYQARAGEGYIAKVRGYDGNMGSYGFHAWLREPFHNDPDEYEDDGDFSLAKTIAVGTPQQHSFTTGDDVDWVAFETDRDGSYTIRVRGANTARLDTYIELYDSNRSLIDEDDDGGSNLDSRLSARLRSGIYYLKVKCLDEEPDQPYTIAITADGS
ncbi:MAG: hypothetical protein LBK63_09815 [Treponema sp.]|jgi:hypothetical protein|nr:hypothetical protein [Treponema sp.]